MNSYHEPASSLGAVSITVKLRSQGNAGAMIGDGGDITGGFSAEALWGVEETTAFKGKSLGVLQQPVSS